jgi:2-dehydropantoate 2-reductase
MNICIVGMGAIGSFIAARLADTSRQHNGPSAPHRISALARGETLAALQLHGVRWIASDGAKGAAPVLASDNAATLGPQDLVIVAVKATALASVAPALGPLLGPQTIVMPAMNGVPWWFCRGLPGLEHPLHSVDPNGTLARTIPYERVLGCVVHASCSMDAPGVMRHKMGQGLMVGEPAGGASDRAAAVVALLAQAGFDATLSLNIRQAIWYKLWGNLTTNPASALTGATVDRLMADPLVRELFSSAMREAAQIGERIGCPVDQSPEDRHVITEKLGAFKTSMLQDAEAGRAIELDAITGAVHELGVRLNIPTPSVDALLGLTRVMARQHGLYT